MESIRVSAQDMVNSLLASGFTEGSLAKEVGTSQPTIHRIKKGSEPSYTLGKTIESIYMSSGEVVVNG